MDSIGNIYAFTYAYQVDSYPATWTNYLVEFAPSANGNASPIASFTSPSWLSFATLENYQIAIW